MTLSTATKEGSESRTDGPVFTAPTVTAKVHPIYAKKVVEVKCSNQ
jgi:hypothetical protein